MIVEDEPGIAFGLESDLQTESYEVVIAGDGAEPYAALAWNRSTSSYSMSCCPIETASKVCRELWRGMKIPIILLTAKTQEAEKVLRLDVGADDY